ncbi:MAG: S41 family peptidase [Fimbriimonas sp.]
MNLRNATRSLRALAGATALMLLTAAAPCQSESTIKDETKAEVLQRVNTLITRSAYVPGIDFGKWTSFIEAEKEKLDAAKTDEEFGRVINGTLAKFSASHIVLIPPRAAEAQRTNQTVGVGITTQQTEDGLTIVRTVKDAPAAKAGLLPGDVIVAVDGKPAEGIRGIPGAEGTLVTLTIKRGEEKPKDFSITRAKFSTARPEELTWIDKDTAKLSIYSFNVSYDQDRVEGFMKEAQRARNLILDLRDNGGGMVLNLEHLLGMFLPSDTPIGTFIGRSLVRRYTAETGQEPKDLTKIAEWSDQKIKSRLNRRVPRFKGNVAVLVNRASGSASEMAAAALRDKLGATVVGTKSAGAVLVSVIVPASNGYMLQYPLNDYVTIGGQRLEGTGVAPDIEVADPKLALPNAKDEVVEKAVQVLVAKTTKPREIGGR